MFRNNTLFNNHKQTEVCGGTSLCNKETMRNHECFVEVEKTIEIKSCRYILYDFECMRNMLDVDTDRPVNKVNYCVVMSACDKCTDVRIVLKLKTFRGYLGRDALKYIYMWALDNKINMEAVFIAYYDSHSILFYLVKNTEYQELLANDGNIEQIDKHTTKRHV